MGSLAKTKLQQAHQICQRTAARNTSHATLGFLRQGRGPLRPMVPGATPVIISLHEMRSGRSRALRMASQWHQVLRAKRHPRRRCSGVSGKPALQMRQLPGNPANAAQLPQGRPPEFSCQMKCCNLGLVPVPDQANGLLHLAGHEVEFLGLDDKAAFFLHGKHANLVPHLGRIIEKFSLFQG
jgi:hypothetical protein